MKTAMVFVLATFALLTAACTDAPTGPLVVHEPPPVPPPSAPPVFVGGWSSDGADIAVQIDRFERATSFVVVRADGSGPGAPLGVRDGYAPSFSPDGARVSYVRNVRAPGDVGQPNPVIAALDGSGERVLSVRAGGPRWSSDGTNIICSTPLASDCLEELCESRIGVVDPLTGHRMQLVPDDPARAGTAYQDFGAVWSPPSR